MISWISGERDQRRVRRNRSRGGGRVASRRIRGAARAPESGQRKSWGKEETAFPPLRSSTELPNIGDNSRVLGPKVARASTFLSAPLFVGLRGGRLLKKFEKPSPLSLTQPPKRPLSDPIIKRSDASRIS